MGWLGPSTPTSELFDTIPALRQVWAWNAESQAYQHAEPNRHGDLPTLTAGMGLWLRLGGNSTFEWSRVAAPDGIAVRLWEGRNLVAVASDGGITLRGAEVRAAWSWDPVRQRYELYRLGDETLRGGDALLIRMASAVNWWQPGSPDPALVFVRWSIPDDTRAAIVAHYEDTRAFFAERFGIVTPGPLQYIGADANAVRRVYAEVFADSGGGSTSCSSSSDGVVVRVLQCTYPERPHHMVDDFLHNLLWKLPGQSPWWRYHLPLDPRGPHWLREGIRLYTRNAYLVAIGEREESYGRRYAGEARQTASPLRHFEATDVDGHATPQYDEATPIGFVATTLLSELAGEPALFDYLRRVRSAADWREAFDGAFGMTVDDFYEAFAAHRARQFPPYPHLTDDDDEAVLVVLDGVPADTATTLRNHFESLKNFYADRFDADAADFTLYIAPDAEAAYAAVPNWNGERSCKHPASLGGTVYVSAWCGDAPDLHYTYFVGARRSGSGAPSWFVEGAFAYAEVEYAEATGSRTRDDFRDRALSTAITSTTPLEALRVGLDQYSVGVQVTRALGYLAVEWLANHAGDPAIFEYYRHEPDSLRRGEGFEGVFGLTLMDFYEQFEAYREALGWQLAPLLPHEQDEIAEPILEFRGDVPDDSAATLRSKFDRFQTFFEEHFEAEPQELTIYALSRAREADEEIHRWSGVLPAGSIQCVHAWKDITILSLDRCGRALDGHYTETVIVRNRGPWWLGAGIKSYGVAMQLADEGSVDLDLHREIRISVGARASAPLSSLETSPGASGGPVASALSFLAVDWLATNVGRHALVDYYQRHHPLPPYPPGSDPTDIRESAFEAAFGLTLGDFYKQFEGYLEAQGTPHESEPPFEFHGNVPNHLQADIVEAYLDAERFFAEQFGLVASSLAWHITGSEQAYDTAYLALFGAVPDAPCGWGAWWGDVGFELLELDCAHPFPRDWLDRHFAWAMRNPGDTRGRSPGPEPEWMVRGQSAYLQALQHEDAGWGDYAGVRAGHIANIAGASLPLSRFEGEPWRTGVSYSHSESLGFLAVEWLTSRAGDRALGEYFTLYWSAGDWHEAFEGAFGLTIEKFYEQFEAYRATLTGE